MKRELKIIAAIVYWLALIGIVGPAMVSQDNTEIVLAGIVLLSASAYATYRAIRRATTKKEPAQ